ncbi:MAG: death on curing protein [Pseudonocardiales bacterium]|jgi:death-on-curing protein|nr:death on curing protein [Pseudonocardiales bacterium]
MESLAGNHALVDGNKRLAWLATAVFGMFNGRSIQAPSVDAGEKFVLAVAEGHLTVDENAGTLALWSPQTYPS